MTEARRTKQPDYGGIFLDPVEIKYEEIDPPLRKLVRLVNSQPWIKTFGCCAGQAHHGENVSDEHRFFIGLFLDENTAGRDQLRLWLDEANRLNGSTGLRVELESVYKHPLGQGKVDGWGAYRVVTREIPRGRMALPAQTYLRMIRCLERAWERLQENGVIF